MTIHHPVRSSFAIVIDADWLNTDPIGKLIDKTKLSFAPRVLSDFPLYDVTGHQYSTFQQVLNDELAIMKNEKADTKHIIHNFDQPTFVRPDANDIPPVKIKALSFDITIENTERPATFTLKNFVKFLLRRISDGQEKHFIAPKSESSS
jgi:hypothetical protein